MRSFYPVLLFACFQPLMNFAQQANRVNNIVSNSFFQQKNITALKPFEDLGKISPEAVTLNKEAAKSLNNFTVLNLAGNYNNLRLQAAHTQNLQLVVPATAVTTTTLNLVHNQITAPGFFVKTSAGSIITDVAGKNDHFIGVLAGNQNSLAAVSLNRSGITGIIADAGGNTVIEPFGTNGACILYNDKDIINKTKFNCSANEDGVLRNKMKNSGQTLILNPQSCKTVKMYVECSYALYQSHQSNIDSVINFVFTLFNASSVLFKNDGINIQLSEIFIWNQPDIYDGLNAGNISVALNSRLSYEYDMGHPVSGDIAHFITSKNLSGGATNRVGTFICSGATGDYNSSASSSIRPFPALPVFSFAVFTFAHETGHALGSPHTQSCLWPGGAIDDCAATEGGCPKGPAPVTGGTIMSYCYNSPFGVNFLNGFGPLPSQLIRDNIENSTCLGTCADTVCTNMQVKGLTTFINDTVVKLKWLKETTKYKIGLKPNTTHRWQFYEVTNADSFVLAKTRCEELIEFTIEPFCTLQNKYGTAYAAYLGNKDAVKLGFLGGSFYNSFSLCSSDSTVLTVRPDSNFIYRWYIDGVIQPQFSSDSITAKKAGKYSVVANFNGCNYYSDTFTVYRFFPSPNITPVINDLKVDFSGTTYCAKRYLWDFGDGTKSDSPKVSHNYLQRGIYNATLQVWDADSNTAIARKQLLLLDEFTDSLNGSSRYGNVLGIVFNEYNCKDAGVFTTDSFNINTISSLTPPRVFYFPNGANQVIGYPKLGTLEFKLFPVTGLVKPRGYGTALHKSDTGYVLNNRSIFTVSDSKFFLKFSKWGGIQIAIDSFVLGDIGQGVTGPIKISQWNTIGLSYGKQGIQLMVNGIPYITSNHTIDSVYAATLGTFNFGTYLVRDVSQPGLILNYKGFEGAIDITRFSQKEKDYTFSASPAWQGKDTVVISKQICFNSSFEGHAQSGTYFNRQTTAAGCDSITKINLTINNAISISDSVTHPLDMIKGSVIIKSVSGGAGPYTFSWNTGAGSSNLNGASPGNYTLTIKDNIGCEKTFSYRLYQLSSNKDLVALLPNPVAENKKITMRIGTAAAKKFDCIIYDIAGRKQWEAGLQVNAGVTDIPLVTGLHKGFYVLHLKSTTEKRSIKFVVD